MICTCIYKNLTLQVATFNQQLTKIQLVREMVGEVCLVRKKINFFAEQQLELNVNNLFTKFTLIFTMQIRLAEKYQSSFAELILIDMKNSSKVLFALVVMLAGVIYLPVQAQQKKGAQRADFSGEWKAKESISMGGNIVCTYPGGDRMLYKTMKIAQQANSLNIAVTDPSPRYGPAASQEKIIFNSKASDIDRDHGFGKKYTVNWSADGQTMTVNSIVRLMIDKKPTFVNVTEVWKLSNNGNSITVQTNAKSGLMGRDRDRNWTTVFDKANWYSKFFM